MNVEYINPFIESLDNFFKVKLKSMVQRGDVGVSKGEVNVRDFCAYLGYNGSVQGIVTILIPVNTALKIASVFEKQQIVVVDDTVTTHLANMVQAIAILAKSSFPDAGAGIKATNAVVCRASEFIEKYPGGVWLQMPFETDFGDLILRVSLKSAE